MLSPGIRLLSRKIYYFPYDLFQNITGTKNKLEPAKGDIYVGSGDFTAQGEHHLFLLKELVNLNPDDTVLDVGSGIGRTAAALTKYLNKNAVYEGFDVVEKGVRWCITNISPAYPNFNFNYVPLNNDLYNNARLKADSYKFPYPDNKFDIVFLFSVFTHMRPSEIFNYLSEIYRVLKPGGKCLATFFLYNQTEEKHISENSAFRFPYKEGGHRLMNKNVKCANIAFREKNIFDIIKNNRLRIDRVVNGYWKNIEYKNDHSDFQDIILMSKIN
jgi:ubiquinone/menaquinone biosynthesis C-methylase UbiE